MATELGKINKKSMIALLILIAFGNFFLNIRYLDLLDSGIEAPDGKRLFVRKERIVAGKNELRMRVAQNIEIIASHVHNVSNLKLLPANDQNDSRTESPTIAGRKLAGLSCKLHGGPSDGIAAEMIYWRDIPRDSTYESPFAKFGPNPKYITFEPDSGGWNNKRMSMGMFHVQLANLPCKFLRSHIVVLLFVMLRNSSGDGACNGSNLGFASGD